MTEAQGDNFTMRDPEQPEQQNRETGSKSAGDAAGDKFFILYSFAGFIRPVSLWRNS